MSVFFGDTLLNLVTKCQFFLIARQFLCSKMMKMSVFFSVRTPLSPYVHLSVRDMYIYRVSFPLSESNNVRDHKIHCEVGTRGCACLHQIYFLVT
jgi:hypothetical protein